MCDVKLRLSTVKWDIVSGLIRWTTNCPYSHIEFEFENGWTLGARFSLLGKIARWLGWPSRWRWLDGVQLRSPYQNRCQTSVTHRAFPKIDIAATWVVQNRLDSPYDLLGILGIVTARGWADSHDAFCSETVQEGAINGSHIYLQNCSPEATTPRDIDISMQTWPVS